MAFSPIDPSRLQGEALNRWYLRSPGEIEQERRAAQAQNYDAFFGGAEPAAPSASYQDANAAIDDGPAWTTNEADRWKGDNQSAYGPASDRQSRYFQVSAASQPLAAPGILDCPTCHGRAPAPLPFPSPFLPGSAVFRDTPSAPAGGGSPRQRFPQCHLQYDNDSETCGGLPTSAAGAKCRESASERLAYCLSHDGEVQWPPLRTR